MLDIVEAKVSAEFQAMTLAEAIAAVMEAVSTDDVHECLFGMYHKLYCFTGPS